MAHEGVFVNGKWVEFTECPICQWDETDLWLKGDDDEKKRIEAGIALDCSHWDKTRERHKPICPHGFGEYDQGGRE